jgi:hypothetical protein
VHDLVLEAAKDGMQGFLHDASPELCELPEIESALRRAVIREATIGRLEIVHSPAIHAALATGRLKATFDVADNVLLQGDIETEGKWATHPPSTIEQIDESLREIFPEGTYRLILEENEP